MLAYSAGLVAAGLVLNVVISAFAGLVPLLLGRTRGRRTLGIVGFVLCIVGGFFLSFIVGVLIAILFAIAVWASSRGRHTAVAA
ncbi:MAG: hypothetical protein QOI27_1486 [Gaiellaceae bacterium]|jgi:hypothetical protein|nr:hypothetical protein [Gaiellaceae bacterium]MDX6470091.1 hypothetical protein [Gaiellaceae bacterium]MDX6473280.1 hypothetical protein [Gaiellaceae bacterium]